MPRAFALACCAVGTVMVLAGLRLSRLGRESRSYTRTAGRILAARLEEIPGPAEEGGPRYRAVVRYAFEARGRTWESEQISYDRPAGSETPDVRDAQREVERFPAGSAVDVWFDPADPRRSVLVRGAAGATVLVAVVVGLALVAVGIFGLAR